MLPSEVVKNSASQPRFARGKQRLGRQSNRTTNHGGNLVSDVSDTSLTVLQAYLDRFQAKAVQNRLEAAGIRAIVTGTDAASAFGMGGAPASRSVRIEVAANDLPRAKQILEQDKQRAAELGPWVCDHCGEQNEATFDICWRCNSPQVIETDDRLPQASADESKLAPITIDESVAPVVTNDGNPYQPVLVGAAIRHRRASDSDGNREVTDELQADVRRAFLSSIVGWLVLPPLVNLYSVYRLLCLPNWMPPSRVLRGQVIAAWFFNLAALILWPLFWIQMLWPF